MKKTLRLVPAVKDYVWGGTKLIEKYGKKTDLRPCAETWELSFHPDGETLTEDGQKLSEVFTPDDLGTACADFRFFPMLIKFIDAKDNLSVQVHPSDDYALANENSYGKTEMWHIVDADEGAGIFLGLSRDVTMEEFSSAIAAHTLTDLLNFIPVSPGQTYFIPAGTLHAIGRGCLICEIQQNSNLTYRVYDYGRLGKDGKERPLHVDKAMKVASLSRFTPAFTPVDTEEGTLIGECRYFRTTLLDLNGSFTFPPDARSFRCVTVTSGAGCVGAFPASAGDSFLIPASCEETLAGKMQILVSSVGH